MRLSPLTIIISSLLVTACGGGSDDTNSAPVISSAIGIADSSANGTIETSESFNLLLKITDADNDTVTGSVELNGASVSLTAYTGNEDYSHQASLSLDAFGDYTATITASDGANTDVTSSYELVVIPNNTEVQTQLEADIANFVAGGEFDGLTLLGKSTDELNTTVGYLSEALSESNIAYNAAPSGECGVSTPHKLLGVDLTSSGITIPDTGMVFPLECLTTTQAQKISVLSAKQSKTSEAQSKGAEAVSYIAQHFIITDDSEAGIGITQTGDGISLEGVVNNVTCGEFTLTKQDGAYRLTNAQIQNSLASLTAESNSFTLTCQRSIEFNSAEETAPLLATISGELQTTDSTSPTGSIDTVTFSLPYLTGGLDQGTVCVDTTISDNSEVVSETVSLIADDGLTDALVLTLDESTNQYCGELQGFDGSVHISQVITDGADNSLTNTSDSYLIEKNDAPVFSEDLSDTVTLKVNEGLVTLISETDVSDPESQVVTLGGETTFDTNQALGEYSITATATDPYDAQSSKTIAITLSDNSAPTANISVSGNPSEIGDAIRDINGTVTLALSSTDSDGTVNDSTLNTSVNGGTASNITNYSSTYSHDISGDGGKTRSFTYQVTDNNGQDSNPATLEFDVHLNTAPTYTGETSYSAERGNCITVEQQATDSENDSVTFAIEGGNWQLCDDNVTQVNKNVTVTDAYSANSITAISANFTACTAPAIWNGSSCSAVDTTPNAFSFTDQTGVALSTTITSNSITVSGINSAAAISISGGSYSVNGGGYTSASGTVNNGDTVSVRVISSGSGSTTTSATLNIGGVSDGFAVTTGVAISTPTISMSNQTIDDNGGFVATSLPAPTVNDVVAGAVYEIVSNPTGGKLTINSSTGVATYLGDESPTAMDYSITIKVTNPDGGNQSVTFNLHVNNNA